MAAVGTEIEGEAKPALIAEWRGMQFANRTSPAEFLQ
jgi:hypothetical protein